MRFDLWTSYAPSAAEPWNHTRVRHLFYRLGFAASPAELQRALEEGFERSITRLLSPDSGGADGHRPTGLHRTTVALARQAIDRNRIQLLKAAWVNEMWRGQDPLGEQLTLMWHNHFATSYLKVHDCDAMWTQNQRFRRLGRGNFGALLQEIVEDRAMIVWLDGQTNRKGHPNENLARELMELFSLGVGHYSETDVREAARALTGWKVDDTGVRFDSADHDAGMKTILGQTARHDAHTLTLLLLSNPATARRLAWRLCDHFLGQPIDGEALEQLAECLVEHQLQIAPALEILLRSKRFFSGGALGQRIRSPVSFVVGGIRAIGLPTDEEGGAAMAPELAASWMAAMGQDLFQPPGVSGWPGGKAWLSTAAMIQRAAFARQLSNAVLGGDRRRSAETLSLASAAAQLD